MLLGKSSTIVLIRFDTPTKYALKSHAKLLAWLQDKDDYMGKELEVTSSGQARNALAYLDAFVEQSRVKKAKDLGEIEKIGLELEGEKFEKVLLLCCVRISSGVILDFFAEQVSDVKAREIALQEGFRSLEDAAKKKRPILEDHLAREVCQDARVE